MSKFQNHNFSGQKALIRVDFNVPLNDKFEITDDNRMRAAIPTIKKILADGGSVILMSHLGRPKEGPTDKYSLKHLINHLSEFKQKTAAFWELRSIKKLSVQGSDPKMPNSITNACHYKHYLLIKPAKNLTVRTNWLT